MNNEKYKNMVLEDAQDGIALGISGTPTFFINGNKLAGKITTNSWQTIIEKSLQALK